MGTHPIFESDFDCLTDRKNSHGSKRTGPGKDASGWFHSQISHETVCRRRTSQFRRVQSPFKRAHPVPQVLRAWRFPNRPRARHKGQSHLVESRGGEARLSSLLATLLRRIVRDCTPSRVFCPSRHPRYARAWRAKSPARHPAADYSNQKRIKHARSLHYLYDIESAAAFGHVSRYGWRGARALLSTDFTHFELIQERQLEHRRWNRLLAAETRKCGCVDTGDVGGV